MVSIKKLVKLGFTKEEASVLIHQLKHLSEECNEKELLIIENITKKMKYCIEEYKIQIGINNNIISNMFYQLE